MKTGVNKKYMIIAVSVLIAEFAARNSLCVARQESNPQSATTYISKRYGQYQRTVKLSRIFDFKIDF